MNEIEQTTNGAETSGAAALEHLAGQYLTFLVAKEFYGIDILRVREIIGVQNITRVPECEPHVKGVINLRGQVIAAIDLRLRCGMEPQEYTEETCIIIVDVDGSETGMIVDRVDEVVDLAGNQIEPPPQFGQSINTQFLLGMGKAENKLVILIDSIKVLAPTNTNQEDADQ